MVTFAVQYPVPVPVLTDYTELLTNCKIVRCVWVRWWVGMDVRFFCAVCARVNINTTDATRCLHFLLEFSFPNMSHMRRPIAMLAALYDLALDMVDSPPPPILLIILGPLILPLILLELWHRTSRTAVAKSQASYTRIHELGVITLGDYCTVSGLTQYGDRNGKRARVVGRDTKKGLWHVIIDGEAQAQDSPSKNGKVALRPENLVPDVPSLQPATVLSARIRRGELTSRALTELCVQQLLRADESLNALTARRFEDALKEADAADAAVAAGRAPPVSIAPLWGVPILVKECFEIAGLPFTAGVASLTGRVGLTTAPSMTRLAEAGLPILGSTNVSEACMFHEAANPSRRWSSNSSPLRLRGQLSSLPTIS